MNDVRFARNSAFFGETGQRKIRKATVAVVGVGGTGSHVVQQLAFLGVGRLRVIDLEELDETNRNRYIGSTATDRIPGTLKVDIAERLVKSIDPSIDLERCAKSLMTNEAFAAVASSDFVFGCVDNEGARLVLTQLCAAYERPLFDIASDIEPGNDQIRYGGRVCVAAGGDGCLLCLGLLDAAEAGLDLGPASNREQRNRIYGVDRNNLNGSGPSVVNINGVVASIATTEFMLHVTGIRRAVRVSIYRGDLGKVLVSVDEPTPGCFVCKGLWGKRAQAGLAERYLQQD